MSKLNKLKNTDVNVEEDKDSLGFGGALDSGIYRMNIKLAYLGESKGGAMSLNLVSVTGEGREFRNILWVTSGDSKGNKTYYEGKDGKKYSLPGFSQGNAIALLTTGKGLADLDTEEKTIKLYNFDAGGEVNTKVDMIMDLIGQQVYMGIIKEVVDKNVQDATGAYVPSGETREQNEIDKIFCARDDHDKMTLTELRAKADKAEFFDEWDKKWTGQVRNKAKGAAAGTAADKPASKPAESIFK